MRKIFTFAFALMAMLAIHAKETVVWTGNEPISWNQDVYAGSQFETPANTFSSLKEGYIIKVSVVAMIDEPQYVMTYKAGEGWSWTDLSTTVADGIMSYTIESDQIGAEIAERSLIFRGQGYNITQIVVDDLKGDDPEPPQPQDTVPYTFTDVWTGDKAISWNTEVYAGEQFDTYALQQDMFAGLAKDDSIKIFYAEVIEGAQFAASYKAGDEWTWTDLVISEHEGFYAYKVASDEMAELIADRGIVLRGQGYHATRIVIGTPKSTTGIDQLENGKCENVKMIKGGQVLIVREEGVYNILGQKVQ